MKKILIILLTVVTLSSCSDELVREPEPDKYTSIKAINQLSIDTTYYKIVVDEKAKRFNLYNSEDRIVYRDCISLRNNQLIDIPIGVFIWLIIIFFFVGLLLGLLLGI